MNSIAVIGILIILAILFPIWLLMRSQSSGKRKLQKKMAMLGKGNAMDITECESWGTKVIGLDRQGAKVAYTDFRTSENAVHIADLNLFERCLAEKRYLENGSKKAGDVISSVYLRFASLSKNGSDLVFPLYEDSSDLTLTNELQIAQEWADKLSNIIRNLRTKK